MNEDRSRKSRYKTNAGEMRNFGCKNHSRRPNPDSYRWTVTEFAFWMPPTNWEKWFLKCFFQHWNQTVNFNTFFQAITPSRTLVIFRPTSTYCSLLKLGIFIIQKDRSPINWCRTCPNKPPMAGFSTRFHRRIPMESPSMPWDFQERIDLSLC